MANADPKFVAKNGGSVGINDKVVAEQDDETCQLMR